MKLPSETLAQRLRRLVQIPSISPDQAGTGVAGEAHLAAAVADWFEAFGGTIHQEEVVQVQEPFDDEADVFNPPALMILLALLGAKDESRTPGGAQGR